MKYINADLLSERIKKNQYVIDPMFIKGDDSYYEGENDGYNRILDIIDSLQQEQQGINLENVVEFECIGKKVKMTIQELINYYIDTECAEVADECGF